MLLTELLLPTSWTVEGHLPGIRNGKIGLSSHHGIHGNSCDGVTVENVTFERFEVAAFALNGSKNVYLRNVTVNGNRQDIPVLATYSAARFIRLFVNRVRSASLSNPTLDAATNALNVELDTGFNNVIFGTGSMPSLFANPSGLIDGTAYGIIGCVAAPPRL